MVSLPRYPCASEGSITSLTVPPLPRIAAYMRSDWIGKVRHLVVETHGEYGPTQLQEALRAAGWTAADVTISFTAVAANGLPAAFATRLSVSVNGTPSRAAIAQRSLWLRLCKGRCL